MLAPNVKGAKRRRPQAGLLLGLEQMQVPTPATVHAAIAVEAERSRRDGFAHDVFTGNPGVRERRRAGGMREPVATMRDPSAIYAAGTAGGQRGSRSSCCADASTRHESGGRPSCARRRSEGTLPRRTILRPRLGGGAVWKLFPVHSGSPSIRQMEHGAAHGFHRTLAEWRKEGRTTPGNTPFDGQHVADASTDPGDARD